MIAKEARKIVDWIIRETNAAWEGRDTIKPCYHGMPRPKVIEILKLLPKTNCGQCLAPTCLVFATQVAEGGKNASDCSPLTAEGRNRLTAYLEPFRLDV